MATVLTTLSNLFTLAFVVTSMFSMGLGLTIPQITAPLRSARLVGLALVANFIGVPLVALLLTRLIPMEQPFQIGLLIYGCAAGAPFLPKLAQIAKGNVALAVGLMTLLMVVTVIYLPIVLPLLLPGVSVSAGAIALSLIVQMLIPLGAGLFIKARYEETAATLAAPMGQIANISLVLLLATMLVTNLSAVLGLLGSGSLIALLLILAVATGAGYLAGGPEPTSRSALALGTGQRNLAAAFVVATGNFSDQPDVLVLLAAAGLVGLVLLMPLAAELGRRTQRAGAAERKSVEPLHDSGAAPTPTG